MNKISKTALSLSLALFMTPCAYADNIEMNTAHIQAMDKITGRVSELNVPVNGLVNFGTFSILVRKCVTKSPEETPENTAFIDVVDNYKSQNPVNIFKGWMFSSTPGINGIEHPIYDIWLLNCYNSDASKHQKLSEDKLKLRDELPMVRQKKPEQTLKLSILNNDIIEEETIDSDNIIDVVNKEVNEINQNDITSANVNNEVIKLNLDEKSNDIDLPKNNLTEEDFVAEDEEIVTETIIIDNETVAQDEENQKIKEETENDKVTDKNIVDEIHEQL